MTQAASKDKDKDKDKDEDEKPAQEQPTDEAVPEGDPRDEKIRELEEALAKLKDQYLRAMAEVENTRMRAKREMEETAKYAAVRFARDMVNIIDNLQRASNSISDEARAEHEILKHVGGGIDMTIHDLLGIFERHGIKRVNPEGEKFDHNLHQAVAQVPKSGKPPGTVVDVLQAGYTLHDRLLKPAMVTVAAADGK